MNIVVLLATLLISIIIFLPIQDEVKMSEWEKQEFAILFSEKERKEPTYVKEIEREAEGSTKTAEEN